MSEVELKYNEVLAEIRAKPYAAAIAHLFRDFLEVDLSMFRVITDQPASEWRAMLINALWWSGAALSAGEQQELCDLAIPFLTVLCPL